ERVSLMRQLAAHTVSAIQSAGIEVLIVSNDSDVVLWSRKYGCEATSEPVEGGLNGAASAGAAAVTGSWMILHADLPAVDASDIRVAASLSEDGHVLAPSHDGGTSLIGGTGSGFPFRYGPGSFHRHLAVINGDATILVRPGLALDLDRPWDLAALTRLGYL
ncbi:MAG: NTP transferase domain-containing protein, partial [Actinomycetota bacterium]|nr:NTP transferase domain-containing protein [Actinomycetota bacterium]